MAVIQGPLHRTVAAVGTQYVLEKTGAKPCVAEERRVQRVQAYPSILGRVPDPTSNNNHWWHVVNKRFASRQSETQRVRHVSSELAVDDIGAPCITNAQIFQAVCDVGGPLAMMFLQELAFLQSTWLICFEEVTRAAQSVSTCQQLADDVELLFPGTTHTLRRRC